MISTRKRARRDSRREWHSKFIVLPRKVMVEGRGYCWLFLERIEARRSQSRRTWLYRERGTGEPTGN